MGLAELLAIDDFSEVVRDEFCIRAILYVYLLVALASLVFFLLQADELENCAALSPEFEDEHHEVDLKHRL